MRYASPEREQLSFSDIHDLSFSFPLDPLPRKGFSLLNQQLTFSRTPLSYPDRRHLICLAYLTASLGNYVVPMIHS